MNQPKAVSPVVIDTDSKPEILSKTCSKYSEIGKSTTSNFKISFSLDQSLLNKSFLIRLYGLSIM
ncbi:hypothetical protein ES708_16383 [subsurface metagenome]